MYGWLIALWRLSLVSGVFFKCSKKRSGQSVRSSCLQYFVCGKLQLQAALGLGAPPASQPQGAASAAPTLPKFPKVIIYNLKCARCAGARPGSSVGACSRRDARPRSKQGVGKAGGEAILCRSRAAGGPHAAAAGFMVSSIARCCCASTRSHQHWQPSGIKSRPPPCLTCSWPPAWRVRCRRRAGGRGPPAPSPPPARCAPR